MTETPADIPEDIDWIATDIVRTPFGVEGDPEWEMYITIARAILAERNRDRWMPIETAPVDGSLIMLACADWPLMPIPVKVGGYWQAKWNVFGSSWAPTHWQPLPNPPLPNSARGFSSAEQAREIVPPPISRAANSTGDA